MSILVSEAVQRVQSLYSKGVQSKNTRLATRHIYSALKTARSTFVRQQYNKNQTINRSFYQILPCIELEKTYVTPAKIKTTVILRTKFKLPEFVSGIDKVLIQSFTSVSAAIGFDQTSFESFKFANGNKYTALKPQFFLRNGYAYITINTVLRAVTLEGLFDDPIEAANFSTLCPCEGCDCKSYLDYDFFVDGNGLDTILKMAYNELVLMFSQMQEDKQPNATDDNSRGGAMVHQPQTQQGD